MAMHSSDSKLIYFLTGLGWPAILCIFCSLPASAQPAQVAPGPGLYPPAGAGGHPFEAFASGTASPQFLSQRPIIFDASPKANGPEHAGFFTRMRKPQRIPGAWNYHHLALFCKLEIQMEKALRMPVRLRLGDTLYVDWLEGKRNTY